MSAVKVTPEILETIIRMRSDGHSYNQISSVVGIASGNVYYWANREKMKAWTRKHKEAKKNKIKEEVKDEGKKETKFFRVKVSGITSVYNIPKEMNAEVEITNEEIIFNIL